MAVVNIAGVIKSQGQMALAPLSVVNSPILSVGSVMKSTSKMQPGMLNIISNSTTLTFTFNALTGLVVTHTPT